MLVYIRGLRERAEAGAFLFEYDFVTFKQKRGIAVKRERARPNPTSSSILKEPQKALF